MLSNAASQCITTAIGARKTKSVFLFLLFLQIMFFLYQKKQVSFCVFTGWYFSSTLLKSILTQDHIGSGLPRCLSERADSVQQRVSLLLGSLEAGLCLVVIPVNYKTSFGLHYTLHTYFEVFRQQLPGWSWTNRT